MVATKTKAGPLTKPYFLGFLGFPEPADESPSLSATLRQLQESPVKSGFSAPQELLVWPPGVAPRVAPTCHGRRGFSIRNPRAEGPISIRSGIDRTASRGYSE